MDNTIQLYVDEEREIKGYPITSPDRVIDENGVNIKDEIDEINSSLDNKASKNEIFSMANMGQDIKEAMTGGSVAVVGENAVLRENLTRGSIDVEHISFLKGSKNLFDISFMKDGYEITNGELKENGSMTSCEKYIPVTPNTTYSLSDLGTNLIIAYYDYSRKRISDFSTGGNTTQITTPINCYFIRFYTFLNSKYKLRSLQIEAGTTLSEYNEYKEFIIPRENLEKDKNIFESKNLFDRNNILDAYNIGTTGELTQNNSFMSTPNFIEVLPNCNYTFEKIKDIIYGVAFYDKAKKYMSYKGTYDKFLTPANCYYIRMQFTKTSDNDVINKIQLVKGNQTGEYTPYKEIIKNDLLGILEDSKNLLDYTTFVKGKELNGNGELVDNTSLMSTEAYIKINPNRTLAITSVQGAMVFCFYDKDKKFIKYQNLNTSETTIINSPSNAEWCRLCTFTNKESYLPILQLEENTVNTSYESYGKKYIKKEYLRENIENQFDGLVWNTLGDSITKMNDYIEGYQNNVSKKLGITTVRNYGIGGTMLCLKNDDSNSDTAMCNRYANMDNNADIITVMGGANDWSGSRKLDSATDRYDKHTIGGAMRTIIEGLIVKYPQKHIIWLTCPPRLCSAFQNQINSKGEQVDNNGNTIEDYVNKQIEVCKEYNIPCIDIHHGVGINRFNIDKFTAADDRGNNGTPDNVHMNELGHKRIASIIVDGFKRFIL